MNLDAERRNRLEYYGFDLDTIPISAFVEDKNGNQTNVTGFLNIVTHYHMTLNLGSEAGDKTSVQVKFSNFNVVIERCP
jgi:hypothetical protein